MSKADEDAIREQVHHVAMRRVARFALKIESSPRTEFEKFRGSKSFTAPFRQ